MKLLALPVLVLAAFAVQAKLPPLSPEAQAKADEAKAKTAWTEKVAAYQLCKSMDRVADGYFKRVKVGKPAAAASAAAPASAAAATAPASAALAPGTPVATPPCTDPGPFVAAAPAASKPLEASGAHSPPATAATPPSSKPTQNELQGSAKKP
jgi:hypothetical protein